MLERFLIAGFKSIKRQEPSLGAVNVFIGANGAGKSNVVSFFNMLHALGAGQLQLFVAKAGGASALLHHGPKVTREIEAGLLLAHPPHVDHYALRLTFSASDTVVFETEGVTERQATIASEAVFRLPNESADYLGGGHKESNLREVAGQGSDPAARHVYTFLKHIGIYHFHDTSPEAAIRLHGDVDAGRALRSRAENLAAFLYRLRNERPAEYGRILATVRTAAPFIQDFVLQPNGANNLRIQLRWQSIDSEYDFGPQHLSDGTLRFIALAALFLQPEGDLPQLIVLDEPELGLHPLAIHLLAGMVKTVSHRCQVILATQSTTLLDLFEPEQIVVTEILNGQTVLRRLNAAELEEWLAQYTLSELWEKNVLGGRP